MLDFFTDPYPNELLFSSISRYHYYRGNIDYRDTYFELFGKKSVDRYDYNYLANSLSGTYDQEELLYNHSLYPFYKFFNDFVPFEKYMCINQQLFFCPECLKNDLERYGEAYFHREHQINGILICPKHRVVLKPYDVGQVWKNINDYNRFELQNVDLIYGQVLDETKYDKLWQISKLSYQILYSSGINRYINEYVLYNYYKKLLYEKGFVNCYGDINESNLEKEIINFYGDEILSILDLGYKTRKVIYWRINSFNEFYRPHDPIRHLLLINFLGKNIIEVINDIDKDYKPFGEGPWKCINSVCWCQDISVIKKVEYISENTEAPYGIFECEYCGLKYSRYLNSEYNLVSHITTRGDRYFIKEILDYGQLWYESLKNYIINDNYSVTKISKIMKCNCNVVKDHAKKLNIEDFIKKN